MSLCFDILGGWEIEVTQASLKFRGQKEKAKQMWSREKTERSLVGFPDTLFFIPCLMKGLIYIYIVTDDKTLTKP